MTGRQKPLVKIQRAELVKFKRAPTLGILLLAAGFIAFVTGIAINWWFRTPPTEPKPPPPQDQATRT